MKSTKKSLIASALSLVLCVSMLLGTTYAWFTDSVTSGKNKIIAGNLKVDLVMDKEENGIYVSIANEEAAIFGSNSLIAQNNSADTLWEPGKTQIVYLGVQNKGNLALKYNIVLNVEDNGLVGALEYAIIDGAKAVDLTDATKWNDITTATVQKGDIAAGQFTAAEGGVLDEIAKGTKDETDYFALAVHMKEEAGNGYQGKDITIDVTILATQMTAESDSFDNQYDKDAIILIDNGNGTYTDPETGSTVIKEGDDKVEVKEDENITGLYVPAEAEAGNVEKQYATTSAAVQAAVENIQNEIAEEETTYKISLINEKYEDVELTFSRKEQGDNKDIVLSSPTRTTIKQSGGVAITINSSSHYYDGEILIENIDFELSNKATAIKLGGDNTTRYSSNITVKDCTLTCTDGTDADAVLMAAATSGSKNITITGCTLNGGHSFFSGASVGLVVKDCVANGSWHAINNTSNGTTVIDCDFDCKGYIIRADHGPVNISNTTMKTAALNDETMAVQQDKTALVLRIPTTDALESNKVTLSNVTFDVPDGIAEICSTKGISKAYVVGAPEGTQFAGFAAE